MLKSLGSLSLKVIMRTQKKCQDESELCSWAGGKSRTYPKSRRRRIPMNLSQPALRIIFIVRTLVENCRRGGDKHELPLVYNWKLYNKKKVYVTSYYPFAA